MKEELTVKGPAAAFITFGAYLLGKVDALVIVLLLFTILDFITGLMRAYVTKSLNSSFGMIGIFKKVAVFIVIAVSAGVEFSLMQTGMDTRGFLTNVVTGFFIVNEAISILENTAQLGIKIPPVLLNALEKLNSPAIGKEQRITIRKKRK